MLLCATGPNAPITVSDSANQKGSDSILEKWPKDFNEKRVSQVCSLFAPDLIARYPDAPDRNYEEMCSHLGEVMHSRDKTYHYDAPQIEEILISGDLAVVRLIWTLKVTDPKVPEKKIIKEIGMDVFKRQKNENENFSFLCL